MILGLAGLVLGNVAALLGARALARRVPSPDPATSLVVFLLFRFALISVAVLVAGVAGLLNPAGMTALAALAMAGLAACGEHRFSWRPALPRPGPLVTAALAVLGLRLTAQVWLFAPHNYDAVSYHLTKIGEWVRAGGFTREMGVDTHAALPAGFELIETWWVVFLRHDALIELAGVEFLILAFAATVALGRHLGLSEPLSGFAALAFVLTPGLHLQATCGLNDAPIAAVYVATAALAAARAPLAVVGVALGLGAGMKPTYVYALPGIALLLWLGRRDPSAPAMARGPAVVLLSLAVITGGFWYARNAIWFGNPIHPVGTRGLIAEAGVKKIQFGPSALSGVRNASAIAEERVYDRASPYGGLLVSISGWGALPLACGMLSLLAACAADSKMRRLSVAFGASLGCVLFLVNHDPWFARFILFFPALPCLAVARMAAEFRPMFHVAVPCLLLQFAGTAASVDLSVTKVRELAEFGWRERSAARLGDAWTSEPCVAYYGLEPYHNRGESYFLYRPDFSCRVVHLREKTPDALIAEMSRGGARVLYVSRQSLDYPNPVPEMARRGLLRRLGPRLYALAE